MGKIAEALSAKGLPAPQGGQWTATQVGRLGRAGALALTDVRSPTLSLVCEPCGRHGRYSVARLMEQHGDAKLTDLLVTLVDCAKARSVSIHDRCKAVYGQRLP